MLGLLVVPGLMLLSAAMVMVMVVEERGVGASEDA